MPDAIDRNHGETAASQKLDKQRAKAPDGVALLARLMHGVPYGGVMVETIKFKLSGDPNKESLAIVTGFSEEDGPLVAFHTSFTAEELFVGVMARIRNGTLKWKEDAYRT